MAASWLSSILVPFTGLILPAVIFAFMLSYIDSDEISES